jgi:hypothetical protein
MKYEFTDRLVQGVATLTADEVRKAISDYVKSKLPPRSDIIALSHPCYDEIEDRSYTPDFTATITIPVEALS